MEVWTWTFELKKASQLCTSQSLGRNH
eukprot:SAG31_NODE_23438_length_504_cov_1.017284_1_plen_26_part_01